MSSLKKNLAAISILMALMLLVFSVSSLEGPVDSEECGRAFIDIEKVCYNNEIEVFYNFHPTISITIKNQQADINGFRIRIHGEYGMMPSVLFKTVKNN